MSTQLYFIIGRPKHGSQIRGQPKLHSKSMSYQYKRKEEKKKKEPKPFYLPSVFQSE